MKRGLQEWAKRARRAARAALLGASLVAVAHAQIGGSEGTPAADKLVQATAAPVSVPAGGSATVLVKLAILPGWHVNANPPALDYNIPTTVTLKGAAGLTPGRVRYPAGRQQKFGFEDSPLLVYDGAAEVRVPVAASVGFQFGFVIIFCHNLIILID